MLRKFVVLLTLTGWLLLLPGCSGTSYDPPKDVTTSKGRMPPKKPG